MMYSKVTKQKELARMDSVQVSRKKKTQILNFRDTMIKKSLECRHERKEGGVCFRHGESKTLWRYLVGATERST